MYKNILLYYNITMFFLFIIDVIASVTFRVIVNIGTWIVYKSGNGIYYMYKKDRVQ